MTKQMHVVVYTYENQDGTIIKLPFAFDTGCSSFKLSSYDSNMIANYGRWAARTFFYFQQIKIIEDGISEGAYDLRRFEI
jgi:hypothetical protein